MRIGKFGTTVAAALTLAQGCAEHIPAKWVPPVKTGVANLQAVNQSGQWEILL